METQKTKRLVCLDLIRVFACLCILIFHFNTAVSGFRDNIFVYPNSIIPNAYLGGRLGLAAFGVSLFFVLSGAALMYTYRDAKRFYQKRVLGIYPMFWTAWAAATVWDFLRYKQLCGGSLLLLVPTLLGLDGYLCMLGVIPYGFYRVGEWFLGCILLLYLIFPLLRTAMKKQPVLTLVLSLLLHALCMGHVNWNAFYMHLPEMLVGMALTQYGFYEKPRLLTAVGAGAVALSLIMWELPGLLNAAGVPLLPGFLTNIVPLLLCIASDLLAFGLLTWLAQHIRRGGLLAALAGLTYPAYLVHHVLIENLVQGFPLETMKRREVMLLFVVYLVLTLLLAKCLAFVTKRLLDMLRTRTQR